MELGFEPASFDFAACVAALHHTYRGEHLVDRLLQVETGADVVATRS
jgi:hypothetical protein